MSISTVRAPFTQKQVESINGFQTRAIAHPLTCDEETCRCDLIAREDGLICPRCGYSQEIVPAYIADETWMKVHPVNEENIFL